MIDESPAGEEFKRVAARQARRAARRWPRRTTAGACACSPTSARRARRAAVQNACDNCLQRRRRPGTRPRPRAWRCRCVYRFQQARRPALRRRPPDRRAARQGDREGRAVRPRAAQHLRHRRRRRASRSGARVLRQLIALGHLRDRERIQHAGARPTARARCCGRGARCCCARRARRRRAARARARAKRARGGAAQAAAASARRRRRSARFAALKAWRAEVARAHNLPAYVVFHDATLAEMADLRPDSLDALAGHQRRRREQARGLRRTDPARAARRPDATSRRFTPVARGAPYQVE